MSNLSSKILVYGGNSAQGIPVVSQLLKEGFQVRVFVRDANKVQQLFSDQVEIVTGSLEDRESLKRANEGIERVFLVLPLEFQFDVATQQGYNAIDAAREASVKLLVFNSSTSIPKQTTDALAFEIKRNIENYIYQSGLPSIIIRPPLYMDNLAAPWSRPSIVDLNVIAYPLPREAKVSWISLYDAAAFAVAALKRPELAGSAFNIGGSEALDGQQIAEGFARVFKRPFTYQQIPIDDFEKGLSQAFGELTATEVGKIYRWREAHPEEDAIDLVTTLQKLPVQLTPFEKWIQSINWTEA